MAEQVRGQMDRKECSFEKFSGTSLLGEAGRVSFFPFSCWTPHKNVGFLPFYPFPPWDHCLTSFLLPGAPVPPLTTGTFTPRPRARVPKCSPGHLRLPCRWTPSHTWMFASTTPVPASPLGTVPASATPSLPTPTCVPGTARWWPGGRPRCAVSPAVPRGPRHAPPPSRI